MKPTGRIAAIVLAAGYSSRMGEFKPLLPIGDTTILERVVTTFREADIRDIRVVIGHRSAELLPLVERLQVRPVLNERYNEGMFSSVIAAVSSLEENIEAFFLLPVDIPLVGDLRRITEALVFPDEGSRREAAERLVARATTVQTALGRDVSWDEAAQAIIRGFERELGLRLEPGDLSQSEQQRAGELVEKKYGHPDWIMRV